MREKDEIINEINNIKKKQNLISQEIEKKKSKLEEVKKAVSNKGKYGKAYILRFFSDIARLRMVVGISAAIANSTASVCDGSKGATLTSIAPTKTAIKLRRLYTASTFFMALPLTHTITAVIYCLN